MELIPLPKGLVFAIFVAFVSAEIVWARRNKVDTYRLKESLASLGTAAISQAGSALSTGWNLLVFAVVAQIAPWSIPINAATVIAGFFAAEFAYYWYHRLSHEIPALWTMHFVHHSSPEYNLLVAPRLSFVAKFVAPVFFVPLILVGFSPLVIAGSLGAGLLFQFFLHTESIGSFGRFEGVLNTPSAHRVHHGTNPEYIDKNYGGALIIFDRLFGTYQPEIEKVRYGVTTGHWGYNPFKLQFQPLWLLVTGKGWGREKDSAGASGPTSGSSLSDDALAGADQ